MYLTTTPDTLIIPVTSKSIPNMPLISLVDSAFMDKHHLAAYTIPAIRLRLIDGTCNSIITHAIKFAHMLFVWQEATREFLCHSLGLQLHSSTQILLA